jgi:hypothetical protein
MARSASNEKSTGKRHRVEDQRSKQSDARDRAALTPIGWRLATTALAGVIAFVLLAGWISFMPLLVVPLLVGGYVGLTVRKLVPAAAVGAGAALIGAIIGSVVYDPRTAAALMNQLPPWFSPDVPPSFYRELAFPILQSLHWSGVEGVAWGLGACLLSGAFAAGASWLMSNLGSPNVVRTVIAWGLIAVLCVSLLVTADRASTALRQRVGVEPANLSYKSDAQLYMKTFYLMQQGLDYYPAVEKACENDGRLAASGAAKNGKFYGFWPKPSYFRQPLPFYLWKNMGSSADWVVRYSVVLGALALAALYAGFSRSLSSRALLIPYLLYPWVLAHAATINVFLPDWWAALFTIFAIALIAADVPLAAAVVALIASLMRFIALPLLAVIEFTALVLLLRRSGRTHMVIVAAVGALSFVGFALLWMRHMAAATPFIDPQTLATTSTSGIIDSTSARPFAERVLSPAAYLMYAYGFGLIWPALLFPAALFGYLIGLSKSRFAQVALTLFVVGWGAFSVAVGPTSSYWGQLYTGSLVIGTAVMLATLDQAPQVVVEAYKASVAWIAAMRRRATRPKEVLA